jgi:hypothetical protein
MKFRTATCLFVAMFLACMGCGGTKLQPAGGKVSVDGAPVKDGTIMFYPIAGGRPANGVIIDGSFSLSFEKPGDGLPPGEYKVVIVADIWKEAKAKSKAQEAEEAMMKKSGSVEQTSLLAAGELIHVVPPEYNDVKTTPLTQSVKLASGAESYVYDISSKK